MRKSVDWERLESLGLSGAEAKAYLAIVSEGRLGAREISEVTGIPRSSVYPVLSSLVESGLIEQGAGYGSTFQAVPPEVALPNLIERGRDRLLEQERLAKELVENLSELIDQAGHRETQVVEIFRNPRVIGERFERLQLSTEQDMDVFVKLPIINPRRDNPVQKDVLKRGVRIRSLYEQAILEVEEIHPYLKTWISLGEEARSYPGELPLKFALFDAQSALLPLETPRERNRVTAVLIHHPALGQGLRVLFESLWAKSEPVNIE